MPRSKNGKRILIRSVRDLGLSQEKSTKIVNSVVDLWKTALLQGESVETPVGNLKIRPRERKTIFQLKPTLKNQVKSIRVLYRDNCEVRLTKKKIDILNEPDQFI